MKRNTVTVELTLDEAEELIQDLQVEEILLKAAFKDTDGSPDDMADYSSALTRIRTLRSKLEDAMKGGE